MEKEELSEKAHSAKLEVLLGQTAFGLGLFAGLLRRSGLLSYCLVVACVGASVCFSHTPS